MCGPHGLKFNQPVELRLPHCASLNPDSWSFALKSSGSPKGNVKLNDVPFVNIRGYCGYYVSIIDSASVSQMPG